MRVLLMELGELLAGLILTVHPKREELKRGIDWLFEEDESVVCFHGRTTLPCGPCQP